MKMDENFEIDMMDLMNGKSDLNIGDLITKQERTENKKAKKQKMERGLTPPPTINIGEERGRVSPPTAVVQNAETMKGDDTQPKLEDEPDIQYSGGTDIMYDNAIEIADDKNYAQSMNV